MIERSCHRHCHIISGRIPGNNSGSYVTVKISLQSFTVISCNFVLDSSWSHDVYLWINICLILTDELQDIICHRATCSIHVFVSVFTWSGSRRTPSFSEFCSSRNSTTRNPQRQWRSSFVTVQTAILQLCARSCLQNSWNWKSVVKKIDPVVYHQSGLSLYRIHLDTSHWLLLDVALSMTHWYGGVH